MEKRKAKSLIGDMRTSSWSRFLLFLLVANFINLSANFYEGNIFLANGVNMEDPIDTITELIFEWALDGGEDLIPDNGTQQDDNSLEKMNLALLEIPSLVFSTPIIIDNTSNFSLADNLISGHFSSDSPPPDHF